MLKNIQIKTVMIFAILGIIMITFIGMFNIKYLENMAEILNNNENTEIVLDINNRIIETKKILTL